MGRKDGNSASGGGSFRNPHNLPVKTCVVCERPFTWRKKWEKCWDEVLTCSQRCKNERRSKSRPGEPTAAAAAEGPGHCGGRIAKDGDRSGEESCEESGGALGTAFTHEKLAQSHSDLSIGLEEDGDTHQQPQTLATVNYSETEEQLGKLCEDLFEGNNSDRDDVPSAVQAPMSKQELRRAHKQSVKAMKAERRAHRTGDADAAMAKHKPCEECSRHVGLLVRCTTDESQQWRMLCGRCWTKASGGVPDGDAEHPHYRYGGVWKNREANAKPPSFGARLQECSGE